MADVTPRNLQVRLLVLVFIAFIPALGLFWYANRGLRELQMEAKRADLSMRAQEIATDYHRLIDEGEAFLGALSEFEEVRTARPTECNERLASVLSHLEHFTTISVIGPDGYMACGSLTPESALYLGDRAYYVRATSTNRFSVGEFALGRITGLPVVGLAHPLFDGTSVWGVLAGSMNLNNLADHLRGGTLPEGFTLSILDRTGRVLVRLPRDGDFTLADSVGAMAGPDFPAAPEDGASDLVLGQDLDGIERLFAVAPLQGPRGGMEGYVALGRTQATLMAEVDRMVSMELRFLAMGGVVLLALAWALGHFWLARCPPEEEATV
jgi:hypothetical protein